MGTADNGSGGGLERRQFTRIPGHAMPEVTARVLGGPHVRLIDLSQRGAQVETSLPLRPGRAVTIRFVTADTTVTLTGAVVRSSIAVLNADGVTYRAALSFAEDIVVCPLTDDRPKVRDNSSETDDMVMVVPAPRETGDALRARLQASSW